MVKFTIEQIRALMDYKDNIRNMSGAFVLCICSMIYAMQFGKQF